MVLSPTPVFQCQADIDWNARIVRTSREMSLAARPFRNLWTLFLVSVASCQFAEPTAEDASAIYGCYAAEGAPSFSLSIAGMRVEGSPKSVPFRYLHRKVGYGVEVALDASHSNGRLSMIKSDEVFFYQRAPLSDPPVIIVAFGPEGPVVNYRRSDDTRCEV